MKDAKGRVYVPFRVRLSLGKPAREYGYPLGAVQLVERDPLPEHGGPITYWLDSETAGALASQLRDATHRLRLRTKKPQSAVEEKD